MEKYTNKYYECTYSICMHIHIQYNDDGQTVLYWNIVDIFMVCFDFVWRYIFGVCLPDTLTHTHTHMLCFQWGHLCGKGYKNRKIFLFFLVVVLNELYCHFMTVRAQFHFDNFSVRSTENREMERAAWKIIREKQTAAMWNANYYALTPMILLITFCDKFEFSMELFSFTTIQLLYVVT